MEYANWKVELYLIYLQVIVAYSKCRSKKRKKEIAADMETLKAGYLPIRYINYL